MRLSHFLLALLSIAALSGCSSVAYKAKMPDVSSNCVDSLGAVHSTVLAYPPAGEDADDTYLEFATVARCHRTADGVAVPVALYRLQGVTPPAEVNVSVMLSPGGTFAAAVDVLDSDFQSLRRYDFREFVRRGSQYSLNVFLNPTAKMPAYLLLTPDREQVGKEDTAIGSAANTMVIPAGPVMFMYNNGTETRTIRPFLEGGKVLVTVRPQSTAIADD